LLPHSTYFRLLELEEQRKQAEADKMAAIRALEARSLEFQHEKEEKKKLEQRIAMLMSQVIRGEKPRDEQDPDAPPEIQVIHYTESFHSLLK